MQRKKAFTLIELLVVIAIIAILAAILFPVFAKAREKARQSACLSNMKQIGNALMMYVQDYDETYPYFAAGAVAPFCYPWDALEPYTKNRNVWICPSGQKENIGTPPLPRPNIGVSIEWFRIDEDPNDWYNTVATMGSVVSPSESIVLGDVRFDTNKPGYVYAQLQGQYIGCSSGIWQVHNNGANITFADGHAKWMSVGQIDAHGGTTPYRYCGIICKKGGANNWFDRE